jgi:hypothetical protein
MALLPAWMALFSRRRNADAVVAINLAVWAGLFLLMKAIAVAPGVQVISPGLATNLIVWLLLFRYSVSEEKPVL